jgi:hypothetical protein
VAVESNDSDAFSGLRDSKHPTVSMRRRAGEGAHSGTRCVVWVGSTQAGGEGQGALGNFSHRAQHLVAVGLQHHAAHHNLVQDSVHLVMPGVAQGRLGASTG